MNTPLGAFAITLAGSFAAQAQNTMHPYSVTRDCAAHALDNTFEGNFEIVDEPNGVGGFRFTDTSNVQTSVSGMVFLSPSGEVEAVNTQVTAQKISVNFDETASSTLAYYGQNGEQTTIFGSNNLVATIASELTKELDTNLRSCQGEMLIGSTKYQVLTIG